MRRTAGFRTSGERRVWYGSNMDHWERMINGLHSGDEVIMGEFFGHYGPALQSLAERNLDAGIRRRVGAATIAQSVCRTFLRRAKVHGVAADDSRALWRLLCAITLNKVREKARYHRRQKRDAGRESPLDRANGAVASGPTPEESVIFADQFVHLVDGLEQEEREVLELRLDDRTQEEIATALGCSERTVRRILGRLEERLRRAFEC